LRKRRKRKLAAEVSVALQAELRTEVLEVVELYTADLEN